MWYEERVSCGGREVENVDGLIFTYSMLFE